MTGTMAGLIVMTLIVVAMNSLLAIAERRLLTPAARIAIRRWRRVLRSNQSSTHAGVCAMQRREVITGLGEVHFFFRRRQPHHRVGARDRPQSRCASPTR